MNLKSLLEFELISTKDFSVTVYDIAFTLLIILVTYFVNRLIKRIFNRDRIKKRFDLGTLHTIRQIIRYFLWVIAISLILETIGIKITFLLAGSAALLVGIGLGLQQIFQDILSGVAILIEGTLKVNDIVEIEGGIVGKVKEIGLRTSKIETRDNIIMIIPNHKFISDNVINWSHMESRTRFNVAVGVAYGSDVELVKEVLLECANKHTDITKKPKPFVRFNNFGDSSLDFQLFFWTTNSFYVENIKSDLRFAINAIFIENKIQIPFPQRDVHIKSQ
jgi:small-conductance mechanosensitive channel